MGYKWAVVILCLMGCILSFSSHAEAFQLKKDINWAEVENQHLVRNYKVKEGLPVNAVNYVLHHADGFLYMATQNGLIRFDGVNFTEVNTQSHPQLKSNRIIYLFSGLEKDLWFTDQYFNLYMLNGNELTHIQDQEPFIGKEFREVKCLDENRFLINLSGSLYVADKEGVIAPLLPESLNHQTQATLINDNGLYYLNDTGLFKYEDEQHIRLFSMDELYIKPDDVISINATSDGNLWLLGKSSNLVYIDVAKVKAELHSTRLIDKVTFWDMTELNESTILISTEDGTLEFNIESKSFKIRDRSGGDEYFYVNSSWRNYNQPIITKVENEVFLEGEPILTTNRPITHITRDKEGSIWVSTNGDGVYQIRDKRFTTIGNQLIDGLENVYGMALSENELWVTAYQNGIYKISEEGIEQWSKPELGSQFILFRSLLATEAGEVWAGNFDLWKKPKNADWQREEELDLESGSLDVLYQDKMRRFWIGTDKELFLREENGLSKYEAKDGNSLSGIRAIRETEEGTLYFATGGQGVAMLSKSNELSFITTGDGLSSNFIRDIFIDHPDTLWVVSEDKGLSRVVKSEAQQSIRNFSESEGLSNNALHTLLEDAFGYLWINSNRGVMRIHKAKLNDYLDGTSDEVVVQKFTEEEGIINLEGNGGVQNAALITSTGALVMANQSGLLYTRPERFIAPDYSNDVQPVIERVDSPDSSIYLLGKKRVILPEASRDVVFKLTLPAFYSPNKVNIQYRLEGVSEGWRTVGLDRQAVFTNIPAGEHKLFVRASSNELDEYAKTEIVVIVPPYFYESTWFLTLVVVWGLGIFTGLIQFMLRRARGREEKLNSIVNQRTKQLLQEKEKTEEALAQVKELHESKTQFFTNFTHELRTPLALILGPLEDVLDTKDPTKGNAKKSLQLIKRNAVKLKDLVNQLLDVSKLSVGELSLSFEKTDLIRTTKEHISQYEHVFEAKQIDIKIDDSMNTAEVWVDQSAWAHVCTNLIGNAIKFTPEKGSINIEFKELDASFIMNISDTGQGIESKDLPFIFDPYYQGNSSITRSGGTGIGLALVKGLVEQMGGSVKVSSVKGEGSTFSVEILKGKAHLNKTDIINSHSPKKVNNPFYQNVNGEELNKSSNTTNKILLVEDNDDFREYLKNVISQKHQVKTAKNGKEGIEFLKSYNPDLVVSDIMMPVMNGYEMMREIRALENYKHIPFIFLSAKDSVQEIETGLNMGADIYMTKPVDKKLLQTQIRVLLRREKKLHSEAPDLLVNSESILVKQVLEVIRRHLGNPDLHVDMISEALSMSTVSLYRNWKKESSETINQLISRLRFEEALKLIKEEELTISEAAYSVGFKHLSYFSRAFKKHYGVSPKEYLMNKDRS